MPTQREDTASVAALVVFVLLGLTGLAGTPRVETDRMFPLLVAAQEEITPCPWFHWFHR
jgi:hypothetical protein